jgi:hypothetical protein
MRKPRKHEVVLTDEQRRELERLINTGRESARKITRARVLLMAADGHRDRAIVAALGVGRATGSAPSSPVTGWRRPCNARPNPPGRTSGGWTARPRPS